MSIELNQHLYCDQYTYNDDLFPKIMGLNYDRMNINYTYMIQIDFDRYYG
jgi:hypothetical protein